MSLYGKIKKEMMPQYGKRIIEDEETVEMLLKAIREYTGTEYVACNKPSPYYSLKEMDEASSRSYKNGYQNGIARAKDLYFDSNETWYDKKAVDSFKEQAYDKGFKEGKEEGFAKGEEIGRARGFAEGQKGKEKYASNRYQEGYDKGRAEAGSLLEDNHKRGYNKGLADGQYNGLQTAARLINKELSKGVQYE